MAQMDLTVTVDTEQLCKILTEFRRALANKLRDVAYVTENDGSMWVSVDTLGTLAAEIESGL